MIGGREDLQVAWRKGLKCAGEIGHATGPYFEAMRGALLEGRDRYRRRDRARAFVAGAIFSLRHRN